MLPLNHTLPRFLLTLIVFMTATLAPSVVASTPPKVRVENIRRAYHNGEHNAFTDMIRWKGKFWLTFRSSPKGHGVNSSAAAIILSSDDAKTWKEVYRFSVAERDTRDPHFLIFRDKLWIYSGTAHVGQENKAYTDWNAHLGYATWTSDGTNWAQPKALEGTYGHYVWRVATRDGKAYMCARRWQGHNPGDNFIPMEAALLESEDGLNWRFVSLFQETMGHETAFLFQPDGELVAVSRSGLKGREASVLARSKAPYQKWDRKDLDGFIGGPMLAHWGDRLVLGGRRFTPAGPRMVWHWLEGTKLLPLAELPSNGDNSYPGLVELDDGRALVSWYSSHEKDAAGKQITAIYLAELALEK